MSRQETYKEIEETLGLVPEQFKMLPDETLGPNWELFKSPQPPSGKGCGGLRCPN